MAEQKRQIVVCSCEDTMPLDVDGMKRGLPRRRGRRRPADLPGRARSFPQAGRRGRRRSPWPAPRNRRCSPRSRPKAARPSSPSPISAKMPAGRATPQRPRRRSRRCSPPRPSRCRTFPMSALNSEGVILIYGRDEKAIEAAELLKDHLDVTVLVTQPRGIRAAAAPPNFPVVQGQHPRRQGLARRVRTHRRRLRRRRAVVARRADVRRRARRRDLALRHHPRPVGRRGPVPGRRSARRLSARRSRRSGRRCCARCCARAIWSAPSTSRAISNSRPICARIRARKHRRLPPLSRSLPDRRDHAGRRSCRDRRADLRRLRPMRRRLPDRRRRLCAAAGRCTDAQAAHAAGDLSRGRRRATPFCCSTMRPTAPS